MRPNERFGGRGQRARTCSTCRRLPRELRRTILLRNEIEGFLDQSNVSKKNIKRLTLLESDQDERIASLASLVRQIAQVKPGRRKRWKRLWHEHRHLVEAANKQGLIDFVRPCDGAIDEDEYWSTELDFLEYALHPEDWFGVWITPRPHEREPSCAHLFRGRAN